MRKNIFYSALFLLLLVNLIPNFIFLFTENFSLLESIVTVTLPMSILLLLFALFKRIGVIQLLLIPYYVLCAFQLVVLYLFGESPIAVDMFLNLPTTNATEATELLNNIWPSIIGVVCIYVPVIAFSIYLLKKRLYLSDDIRYKAVITGAIGITLSIFLCILGTSTFYIRQDIYPFNVINNVLIATEKWEKSENYPITSSHFQFHAARVDSTSSREIYILVIGEASRADNWQLSGYPRETTPKLAQRNDIFYFKDALTQSNTTHKSVPLILTHIDAMSIQNLHRSKSIITAMNEAGYKTLFLSNQTPNRSYTDYFAEEASVHCNIRSGNLITTNAYDMTLVDSCKYYIDNTTENLFIVFHSYGSHFKYEERYPETFSYFTPDKISNINTKERQALINSYDNSIRYTDYTLNNLISMIESYDVCAGLLYTSDHGEDLLDDERKRFLHASPYPTYYQIHIPFFIWLSDKYINHFPEKINAVRNNLSKSVSTSNVFHTLMDMASVDAPLVQPHNSLLSEDYINQLRYYLSDSDQAVPFNACGLKRLDFIAMKKHKICLDLNTLY